jgi:hypothetical protein
MGYSGGTARQSPRNREWFSLVQTRWREGARFENTPTPETIGRDLHPSVRIQPLTEESGGLFGRTTRLRPNKSGAYVDRTGGGLVE